MDDSKTQYKIPRGPNCKWCKAKRGDHVHGFSCARYGVPLHHTRKWYALKLDKGPLTTIDKCVPCLEKEATR